jgi:hypothetical protein
MNLCCIFFLHKALAPFRAWHVPSLASSELCSAWAKSLEVRKLIVLHRKLGS